MQNRSTGTPSWEAEALKRDALKLALLRCEREQFQTSWGLSDAQALFKEWRKLNPKQRELFLHHARGDGTFAELDGGGR